MQKILLSKIRRILPTLLEDQPVYLAYVYGSTVTGDITPFSDVDVALVTGAPLSPLARLRLIQYLQLALYEHCDILEADVRVINDAPLMLQGEVITNGVLVYARDEESRIAYETTTRMSYFDYLPVHQRLQAEFFADIRARGLYG